MSTQTNTTFTSISSPISSAIFITLTRSTQIISNATSTSLNVGPSATPVAVSSTFPIISDPFGTSISSSISFPPSESSSTAFSSTAVSSGSLTPALPSISSATTSSSSKRSTSSLSVSSEAQSSTLDIPTTKPFSSASFSRSSTPIEMSSSRLSEPSISSTFSASQIPEDGISTSSPQPSSSSVVNSATVAPASSLSSSFDPFSSTLGQDAPTSPTLSPSSSLSTSNPSPPTLDSSPTSTTSSSSIIPPVPPGHPISSVSSPSVSLTTAQVDPSTIHSEPSSSSPISSPDPVSSLASSSSSTLIESSSISSSSASESSQVGSVTSSNLIASSLSFSSPFSSAPPGITLSAPPSSTILTTGLITSASSSLITSIPISLPSGSTDEETSQDASLGMIAIAPSLSTLSSPVFITTTNSEGVTITTAPREITRTSTSTRPDGSFVTITQVYSNPTLSPDGSSKENSFFRNVGAVVSVFILAGLVAGSIVLWIIFAMRRRRRTRRLEHDTAVSASLAAAGLYRTPLDDDDDERGNNTTMGLYHSGYGLTENPLQVRSISSLPSVHRTSAVYHDNPGEAGEFALNPFEEIDYIVPARARDGYVSGNGLELAGTEPSIHSQENNIPSNVEPLLTSYRRTSLLNPAPPNVPLVSADPGIMGDDVSLSPSPSMNPIRYPSLYSSSHGHSSTYRNKNHDVSGEPLIELNAPSDASVYSNDGSLLDDRLDPGLRQRLQRTTSSKSELRDEEDYSRPIFGVRNASSEEGR